ncbi:PepSY1/2 domain-containing protein [Edaphobacillus lindanitolerans]|uniref:Spore germination protein n=1 Tax=Edaphobacillus lindanitolerans TaxID=550447 RepID=A0A1U7PL35_9BACI|nr:PepSY1/2 domain-containing protein [Edaphobacillus lindanitolerans]SIT66560.1 spore germination protein [Edaphobacillus lindanitolerans]
MKKLLFLFCYATVALAVFSWNASAENEKLNLLLNGQYSNKLSESSEQLTDLEREVRKVLLYRDESSAAEPLGNIWRLSSEMKNNLSSLPLDHHFSTEWMNYLTRLGDYADLASRGAIPQEKWEKALGNAAANLSDFSGEWSVATEDMFTGGTGPDEWFASMEGEVPDKRWANLGHAVKTYAESDFPLTTSEHDEQKKKDLQLLSDQPVKREDVIREFKNLFPGLEGASVHVSESRKDAVYPFYHIRFQDGVRFGYADFTKKGGHLLSLLIERPAGEGKLSEAEIRDKAGQFLKQAGYEDVVFEESRENSNYWHLSFVRIDSKTGAKVFADGIQVKAAKDNGEILGVNSMEYIQKEDLKPQPIKPFDPGKFFSAGTEVHSSELAYTANRELVQRLCHLLIVTKETGGQKDTYRVMVDTDTGEVLKNELLH